LWTSHWATCELTCTRDLSPLPQRRGRGLGEGPRAPLALVGRVLVEVSSANTPRVRRLRLLRDVLVCAATALTLLALPRPADDPWRPYRIGSLEGLARRIDLRFPDSATLIAAEYYPGFTCCLKGVVELPLGARPLGFEAEPDGAWAFSRRLPPDAQSWMRSIGALGGAEPDLYSGYVPPVDWARCPGAERNVFIFDQPDRSRTVVCVYWLI